MHIHHHDASASKIDEILTNTNLIMASITELNAKVDTLQTALDEEQQQIAQAIADLQQTVTNLEALIVSGGTEAERQALSDKLDAIVTDLKGTIPDVVIPPPTPETPTA